MAPGKSEKLHKYLISRRRAQVDIRHITRSNVVSAGKTLHSAAYAGNKPATRGKTVDNIGANVVILYTLVYTGFFSVIV
jgi:hypothetical protein